MQKHSSKAPLYCFGGLLAAAIAIACCASAALLAAALFAGGGRSAGGTAGSEAEIPISEKTVYYKIEGSTAQELRQQMDRLGPLDDNGRRWSALTRWHVHWSYSYDRRDGECATGPVKVRLEITFTMPRWDAPAGAPQDLVERWQAYLSALEAHERGHAEIAEQAAEAVLEAMQALPVYLTCQALETDADALGERIIDQYRQRQADYDRETGHGHTQGAHFP